MTDALISDPELMNAIRRQDRQAFETLFDRYNHLVFSTAYRVLQDVHGAEDVAQEVFVRLWRNPGRYDETRGRFSGWLAIVTRNRAIDEVRSRRRRPPSESQLRNPDDPVALADTSPSEAAQSALDLADMSDQREMVRKALADLPETQRMTIELAYYEGLTQVEIAKELDTPLGTVKTRVRLGMQKLRVALEGRVGTLEIDNARSRRGDA